MSAPSAVPLEAAGAVDAQTASTAPWKTLRTRFPQLPTGIIPRYVIEQLSIQNGTRELVVLIPGGSRLESALLKNQPEH